MVAFDYQSIQEKLNTLREITEKLEELKKSDYSEFTADFKISDAALRNLTLGIDVIVDIGGHILSEIYQTRADSYSDVIVKLGEAEVIPREFSLLHSGMPKFRNRVIHDYGHIELDKIYSYLEDTPDVFRAFALHFQKILERQNSVGSG